MADFNFGDLKTKYEAFRKPKVIVTIDGNDLNYDDGLAVAAVEVELTGGYEASIATVTLVGCFDPDSRSFDIKDVKKYLFMGSSIIIYLGYSPAVREVFRGFIARVHFTIPEYLDDEIPAIELTCMDVKGLLMANRHSKRLKSQYFSDAVREILEANSFIAQKDSSGKSFTELNISNTPDKPQGQGAAGGGAGGGQQTTTDRRVEMVEESDYEFIVKAAKRYNFEFFVVGSNLYFIEAKKNTNPLIELGPLMGMIDLDVGYDMTGLVKSVVVRNIDMGQGKYIGDKKKSSSKISMGNKAKPLVENQSLVYIDPTTDSKEEAGYRAAYLMDSIDYRLGSVTGVYVGMPELIPGRFITLTDFGKPLNNNFYLTSVRHSLTQNTYTTRFEGVANNIGS
ncbi:MAG: phage late control D family protein [Lachnospiraceae bacterium]|nr:phage late control D family protein [Lachnospiraceae bacterium]